MTGTTAVVVPTFRAVQTEAVLDQLGELTEIGEVVIVANSRESAAIAAGASVSTANVSVIDQGRNLGFGAAVNTAMATTPAQCALVLNDDVAISSNGARQMRNRIDGGDDREIVLFHGGSAERTLGAPTAAGTLLRTSGLWMLRKFMPDGRRGRAAPFSAAYVSPRAWSELGGFDVDRYPLYFEDADLLARASALGIEITQHHVELSSATSQTSRHYTETIWCAAIGARNYLVQHQGWNQHSAAAAVRASLVLRGAVELARGRRAAAITAWRVTATKSTAWRSTLPPYG